MPVHSEFRQPRISSSSAIASKRSVRSLTRRSRRHVQRPCPLARLLEARLDRVPVDPAVLHLELVRELVDLAQGGARCEPERHRLLPPPGLLAGVDLRELLVRRRDRAGMLEGLALPLLPEDLVDHYAASASTTRSTHATSSRESRRNASRSADAGPRPVTTARSFSQSGSV